MSLRIQLFAVIISFFLFFPSHVKSDRIHLKNGKVVILGQTWEEDGIVKGMRSGNIVGYPIESINKIVKDQMVRSAEGDYGFKFDVWYSGMHILDIFDVADNENIRLLPHGIHNPSKKFNRKICMQYLDNSNRFEYRDNLMGHWATVSLWITPESRMLHTIEIIYSGKGISRKSPFRWNLQNLLNEKYGKPIKSKKTKVIFESVYWKTNDRNMVELKSSGGSLTVVYKDFQYARASNLE